MSSMGPEQSLKIEQQQILILKNLAFFFWVFLSVKPFRLTTLLYGLRLCFFLQKAVLHRKEVIQPHLPIRLPCYDLTPIIEPTFGSVLLAVRLLTSGVPNFHGLTGGVYKARERIHRGMLIRDY